MGRSYKPINMVPLTFTLTKQMTDILREQNTQIGIDSMQSLSWACRVGQDPAVLFEGIRPIEY